MDILQSILPGLQDVHHQDLTHRLFRAQHLNYSSSNEADHLPISHAYGDDDHDMSECMHFVS